MWHHVTPLPNCRETCSGNWFPPGFWSAPLNCKEYCFGTYSNRFRINPLDLEGSLFWKLVSIRFLFRPPELQRNQFWKLVSTRFLLSPPRLQGNLFWKLVSNRFQANPPELQGNLFWKLVSAKFLLSPPELRKPVLEAGFQQVSGRHSRTAGKLVLENNIQQVFG